MVVNMSIVARIKLSCNLKNSSSAVGYYFYTNRSKMKRILKILTFAILISSCSKEKGLEGIWYGAYTISNGKKEPLLETTLLHFKDNHLYTIRIRDLSTGALDKVNIDTSNFEYVGNKLKLDTYAANLELSKDSIILEIEHQKLVLRRIPDNLKNVDISTGCFHNSFIIKSKNYQDSIDFVNDSLVIFTGMYDQKFPGKKWQIVVYGGFKFLNIQSELHPVTIIQSCNSNGIGLIYPTIEIIEIKLIPTIGQIGKERLIGKWKEVENAYPTPPPPPNLTESDLRLSINIKNDSIDVQKYGRIKTHKWGLTSDGKRIYFFGNFLKSEGSWKLLDLSDSSMTVRISSHSGVKKEIVKFKKIK